MQPCQKKRGTSAGERLAALSNPAWSYELAAQEDRILAAWVMAPPIFYRNFAEGGGFQWGEEMMTMRAKISSFDLRLEGWNGKRESVLVAGRIRGRGMCS